VAFAARLRDLRVKSRKSLQEVADEVGASKAHIWDLETGRATKPSIELLMKLSNCFDVSVAYLIGETEPGEDADPELIAMFRDLQDLSEADRKAIRNMMAHFKSRET
jgi:transcriptional regulator with XRE-family HTH domain